MSEQRPAKAIRFPVVLAIAAAATGVIPVFLTGALTVQIRRQLHFSADGLGLVVAIFFFFAIPGSLVAGQLADRSGPSLLMRLGSLGSALCLGGVALLAHSFLVLALLLGIAGFTDGLIQPAVNSFLAGRVRHERQGLAFGVKQSGIPLSTLLGGLAVPVLALTVGWRWAFVAAAGLALLTVIVLPSKARLAQSRLPGEAALPGEPAGLATSGDRGSPGDGGLSRAPDSSVDLRLTVSSEAEGLQAPLAPVVAPAVAPGTWRDRPVRGQGEPRARAPRVYLPPLLVLAAAVGIGAGAANSLGAFLVSGAVAAHLAEGTAGLLSAFGSVCGLTSRVVVGARADSRSGGHLRVVAVMLLLGAGGYGLLATEIGPLMLVGAALAFAAGWGWNGLFNFAVVRTHPEAPGKATAITQSGIFAGAVLIPPTFGLVVAHVSYGAAWLMAAVLVVVASGVVLLGREWLIRSADGSPGRATISRP